MQTYLNRFVSHMKMTEKHNRVQHLTQNVINTIKSFDEQVTNNLQEVTLETDIFFDEAAKVLV